MRPATWRRVIRSNGNLLYHDTDDTNRSFDDTRTIHRMAKMVLGNANRPAVIMASIA